MLKNWNELRAVDVTPYVEKKKDLSDKGKTFEYLPWDRCVQLLHENGAETVYYYPVKDEKTGSSLRRTDQVFEDKNGKKNSCYEVVVHIIIDDLEFDMTYPVISGSSIIHEMTMSQQKVSTAIQRAFVKGVAIRTGLGFGLWSADNDETVDRGVDDISIQDPAKLYKKIGQLFAMKMRQTGMSEEEIGAKIGIDENPGAILGNLCKQLQVYEAKLNDIR